MKASFKVPVHVIASSCIGWLLHHHFIHAKLEELYLPVVIDNSKKV